MTFRMDARYRGCFAACLIGSSVTVLAQVQMQTQQRAAAPQDSVAVLQRISSAARELSYAGVFVHSTQDSTLASRITHVSSRGEEWERIESLDGPPQEIIRRNMATGSCGAAAICWVCICT